MLLRGRNEQKVHKKKGPTILLYKLVCLALQFTIDFFGCCSPSTQLLIAYRLVMGGDYDIKRKLDLLVLSYYHEKEKKFKLHLV